MSESSTLVIIYSIFLNVEFVRGVNSKIYLYRGAMSGKLYCYQGTYVNNQLKLNISVKVNYPTYSIDASTLLYTWIVRIDWSIFLINLLW